ncbi:MAG TPA: error-prone DNA polymerase [Acidimicrobiales bacterium]|nr:error-prone DNA polymerase [Acidimicrobiales bacterium]
MPVPVTLAAYARAPCPVPLAYSNIRSYTGDVRGHYAELHCHSNFSFLDGASHPDELVDEAVRLGLDALALTDHDGMYGAVRFAEAAAGAGLPTVFGTELTLGLTKAQVGAADPEGAHVVVLARDPVGYGRLCQAVSAAHLLGGQKGRPMLDISTLATIGCGTRPDLSGMAVPSGPVGNASHWLVLTGCRKGPVPSALMSGGPGAARAELEHLQRLFGRDNVVVEIWDHGEPLASARNDALVEIAYYASAEVVATNNVHYHRPERARLGGALAAVRSRRSLDDIDGWLPAAASAHLRSAAEQERWFARYPGAVERAATLGSACAFNLELVSPKLPPFPTPEGYDEMAWLRHLTEQGALRRYGARQAPSHPRAYAQIDYELDMIESLGFAGYFLIVWDIVRFCNEAGIYCQGRGSAANSAVCYALGITKADAVGLGLLFERFLSPERDGPPDIDVDIESERREEAIQYAYNRYGRAQAAQVANVITYRPRSAVRDMGKALGASPGQVDAWSKSIDAWGQLPSAPSAGSPGDKDQSPVPSPVLDLSRQVLDFPRHLGIHSGGMVLCDRPVSEVCPVEWARMANRSVLQWDKDDCARAGLVKFDMLGLGMLSALHATVDHIKSYNGTEVDLADIPQEPEVYDMLCRADSVGIFQVESRAQMATLPRLRPRTFYDLVIEVALIRPGPIQGNSVHPYLRRRNGTERVTYLHPLLEPSLKKTLGVPLFQEQLMQMAIDVAGFSPAEADQLRQAMGSKRSAARMEKLKSRFYAGLAERGASGPVADQIWAQMAAFANFGFPESHSVSFAYLVYSSAWLKLHYPAAFLAGLLDSQPMGFWSPQSLVLDARRHGVEVRRPDVNASAAGSLLQKPGRVGGGPAVRLGLSYVRNIGQELAGKIASGQPYADMEAVVSRCELTTAQTEALATAGAFDCFGLQRREALWAAGALGSVTGKPARGRRGERARSVPLEGLVTGAKAPALPGMTRTELNRADLWATGLSPDSYPTEIYRDHFRKKGLVTAAELATLPHGSPVAIGGVVTHRQRPMTAKGTVFVNLEDETGLVNVICTGEIWKRFGTVARSAPALVVKGRLEKVDGAINLLATHMEALAPLAGAGGRGGLRSRDFH